MVCIERPAKIASHRYYFPAPLTSNPPHSITLSAHFHLLHERTSVPLPSSSLPPLAKAIYGNQNPYFSSIKPIVPHSALYPFVCTPNFTENQFAVAQRATQD